MKIGIIGSGSMGVAMGVLLSNNGHEVSMWSPFEWEAELINTRHAIIDRLPDVVLPDNIICYTSYKFAVSMCEMVVIAAPSQKVRESAHNIKPYVNDNAIIVCCSKGLEDNTCNILTDVIEQELPGNSVVAISGPSYAIEIAKGMPTAVVAASKDIEAAKICQDIFMNSAFRVYTSNDILGVEVGGALKNIIALCAGINDGLGYGDDSKAALLTRGIEEIARLGAAMGAERNTFFGLTGIGDLILTCTGKHSRNKQAGILIGQGMTLEAALNEVNMVVEGVSATKPAIELADKYKVEVPIISETYKVLFEGKDPRISVTSLMCRDKKSEFS